MHLSNYTKTAGSLVKMLAFSWNVQVEGDPGGRPEDAGWNIYISFTIECLEITLEGLKSKA